MALNYKHLRYFWMVAHEGGVLRAAQRLSITPQTISGQIALLEDALGTPLLRKSGRGLALTDEGRHVVRYADEIFALGGELEETMKRGVAGREALEFRVGIADAVPKSIAYRLVEPATRVDQPVRIVCREGKLAGLLAELAIHKLDLVVANAPMPPAMSVRAFNHALGRSGLTFFAAPALHRRCRGAFPACLQDMPMLMPGEDSPVAPRLRAWFARHDVRPRVVGEFDDSALAKAFGQHGQGIFTGLTVLEAEIEHQFGVKAIGRTADVTEELVAISVERRLRHPCVVAITDSARGELFVQQPE